MVRDSRCAFVSSKIMELSCNGHASVTSVIGNVGDNGRVIKRANSGMVSAKKRVKVNKCGSLTEGCECYPCFYDRKSSATSPYKNGVTVVKAITRATDCEPGLYVSGEYVAGPRFLTVNQAMKYYGHRADNCLDLPKIVSE